MSNSNEIEQVNSLTIIEGLDLKKVEKTMYSIKTWQEIAQKNLTKGHDYGKSFPGSKPSLLKPGAEKILMLLGLSSEYEILEKDQDYDEGFFAYTVKCILKKNGLIVTEGLGHCNSMEKKYESEKQDKYMLGNTCLKMAKKRAQVDAALTVGSLSDIFTQDLEDMAQYDQNEKISNMTKDEAKNYKLTFGKHKGKTLGEVYNTSPDYIDWLMGNARTDNVIKKACDIIVNENKVNDQDNPKEEENNSEIDPDYSDVPF